MNKLLLLAGLLTAGCSSAQEGVGDGDRTARPEASSTGLAAAQDGPPGPHGSTVPAAGPTRAADEGQTTERRRRSDQRGNSSAAGPRPDGAPKDLCRAGDHQHLVGRHRRNIPLPPAGKSWRVTCTDCALTMDLQPGRLNIFYDRQTGMVEEVRCG